MPQALPITDDDLKQLQAQMLELLSAIGTRRLALRGHLTNEVGTDRDHKLYEYLSIAEARLFGAYLILPAPATLGASA